MFNKILFPIDIQEPDFSKSILRQVGVFAGQYDASLHLLTVVPGYSMPLVASYFPKDAMTKTKAHVLDLLAKHAAEQVPANIEVTTRVSEGRAYEEIVAEADRIGADLIIMPSHDRHGLHGVLLGSCAGKVVEHAHCSVLVVRNQ